MDNWEIYNYINRNKGGSSEDSSTLDALIEGTLTEITNDRVTSVRQGAFRYCKLQSVNLPNVTIINLSGFMDCSDLLSANFPQVTTIGNTAFGNCTNLRSAVLPKAEAVSSACFSNCPQLQVVDIPNAKKLNNTCFYGCINLENVDFPNVFLIYDQAFRGCNNLTSVKLTNNQVVGLTNVNVFLNTPIANGTGYIYVPDDLVEDYKTTSNWTVYADQIRGLSEMPEEETE